MARQEVEAPPLQPWERQPGESIQAFEAWKVYRDLRDERSLVGVARIQHKGVSIMGRWSGRWSWVERAAAFDNYEDRLARKATIEAIEEMGRRHIQVSQQGVEVLALPVRVLSSRLHNDPEEVLGELNKVPTPALLRLARNLMPALEQAIRLERVSRGQPSEVIEEHRNITEQTSITATVEIPDDVDRLREVAAILKATGALDFPDEVPPDAEADAVHPSPTDP